MKDDDLPFSLKVLIVASWAVFGAVLGNLAFDVFVSPPQESSPSSTGQKVHVVRPVTAIQQIRVPVR